jgi:hypothetical protein
MTTNEDYWISKLTIESYVMNLRKKGEHEKSYMHGNDE